MGRADNPEIVRTKVAFCRWSDCRTFGEVDRNVDGEKVEVSRRGFRVHTREMISLSETISSDLLEAGQRERGPFFLVRRHFWLFLPETIPKIVSKTRRKFRDSSRFAIACLVNEIGPLGFDSNLGIFLVLRHRITWNLSVFEIRFRTSIICKSNVLNIPRRESNCNGIRCYYAFKEFFFCLCNLTLFDILCR